MTEQFIFTRQSKTWLAALMGIGALCILLTFLLDNTPGHARVWTNILHNTVFFTGLAFCAVLFLCAHTLAYGGWQTAFKRVPEAMLMFLPIGAAFILMIGLGIGNFHSLYEWGEPGITKTDKLIAHKAPFLNKTFYFLTIPVVLLWFYFGWNMRKLSVKEDSENPEDNGFSLYKKRKAFAAIFLPVFGFTSAYAIWQWVMSLDAHWYSTLFAWYCTASIWVASVAFMILVIMYLKGKGYLKEVNVEHYHDLGKYVFGFSVFWTYLFFSQFMLIWYANNGEETQYFDVRMTSFPILFYANLVINFLLPFFVLMRNDTKRKYGTMAFISCLVVFGHWLDYYQMVKPNIYYRLNHAHHNESHDDAKGSHGINMGKDKSSTYNLLPEKTEQGQAVFINNEKEQPKAGEHQDDEKHDDAKHENHGEGEGKHGKSDDGHSEGDQAANGNGHGHSAKAATPFIGFNLPGLLEIGTMAGFLGLFLFVMFTALTRASLRPNKDPYYEESVNHHVM